MAYFKCCTCIKILWLLATTIQVDRIDAFTLPVEVTTRNVGAKLIKFNATTPSVGETNSSDELPTSSDSSLHINEKDKNYDQEPESTSELPLQSDDKSEKLVEKTESTSELPIKSDEKVGTSTITLENKPDLSSNLTLSSSTNPKSNGSIKYTYEKLEVTEENTTTSDKKPELLTESPVQSDVKPESSDEFTINVYPETSDESVILAKQINDTDDLIILQYPKVPGVTATVPIDKLTIPSYTPENVTDDLIIPQYAFSERSNITWYENPDISTETNLRAIYWDSSNEKENMYKGNTSEPYSKKNYVSYKNIETSMNRLSITTVAYVVDNETPSEAKNKESYGNQKENSQQLSREDIFCMSFVPLVVVISIIIYVYVSCRKQGSYTVNYIEDAEEADSKL